MMRNMILMVFIVLFGTQVTAEESTNIQRANKAYTEGFFENAASIYEKIIANGQASPDLYYNLGNSYFKLNDYPRAILNYERGLKMAPSHSDLKYNLRVVNSRLVDKIDVLPELFYIRWWKTFTRFMSANNWAIAAVVTFALVFVLLALFFLSRSERQRRLLFYSAGVILLLNILTGIIAWYTYHDLRNANDAIVFTPTLPVKNSPDDSSIDVMMVHEGLKVNMLDRIGDWVQVRVPNGTEGWVKSSQIEPV